MSASSWVRENTRWALYLRDGLTCFWCGQGYSDGVALTLDHVRRREDGGDNSWGSVVTACWRCNSDSRPRKLTRGQREHIAKNAKQSIGEIRAYQKAAAILLAHGAPWVIELRRRAREDRTMTRTTEGTSPARVVNITRGERYDVYIGRPGKGEDGYFGNPSVPLKRCSTCEEVHGTRSATIECFEVYARRRAEEDPEWRSRVAALHGLILGCFCTPSACHGSILSKLAMEWSAEEAIDPDVPF